MHLVKKKTGQNTTGQVAVVLFFVNDETKTNQVEHLISLRCLWNKCFVLLNLSTCFVHWRYLPYHAKQNCNQIQVKYGVKVGLWGMLGSNMDIVAQSMELSLIPADFNNNNKDILGQAWNCWYFLIELWWIMNYGLLMRKLYELWLR